VTTDADTARLHLLVQGRVQGVGFRWFTARAAEQLGLRGWVRNRSDGAVELCIEGPTSALAALRAAVSQGPAGARVDRVEELPVMDEGEPLPLPFEVRR
jgi:acylphosphatase